MILKILIRKKISNNNKNKKRKLYTIIFYSKLQDYKIFSNDRTYLSFTTSL